MRAHSARPLPIPKCSSAVAATLPAPPAALSPVYTDVVRRESMAVTRSIGNFVGSNLAAAVSALERNDGRAISRDQAPATTSGRPTQCPPPADIRESCHCYHSRLISPVALDMLHQLAEDGSIDRIRRGDAPKMVRGRSRRGPSEPCPSNGSEYSAAHCHVCNTSKCGRCCRAYL
jgi:hypothetical protein